MENNLQHTQKHQFSVAIFDKALDQKSYLFDSKSDVYHRLVHVLRVQIDDHLVLFNQQYHTTVSVVAINKKTIELLTVSAVQKNKSIQPHIIFMLPILKRDAMESALYSLTEMGVNEIQLVLTDKSQSGKIVDRDLERWRSIIIGAAEQAKVYAYPLLHAPAALITYMDTIPKQTQRIVFDWSGVSFFDVKIRNQVGTIYLAVGPEGNFSEAELEAFEKSDFMKCALTNTVLRSSQAVALGAGLFRLK